MAANEKKWPTSMGRFSFWLKRNGSSKLSELRQENHLRHASSISESTTAAAVIHALIAAYRFRSFWTLTVCTNKEIRRLRSLARFFGNVKLCAFKEYIRAQQATAQENAHTAIIANSIAHEALIFRDFSTASALTSSPSPLDLYFSGN
jgi:3-deoxy-D-manno-octulosonic-acid transferase